MIWGYPYFWKHPYDSLNLNAIQMLFASYQCCICCDMLRWSRVEKNQAKSSKPIKPIILFKDQLRITIFNPQDDVTLIWSPFGVQLMGKKTDHCHKQFFSSENRMWSNPVLGPWRAGKTFGKSCSLASRCWRDVFLTMGNYLWNSSGQKTFHPMYVYLHIIINKYKYKILYLYGNICIYICMCIYLPLCLQIPCICRNKIHESKLMQVV